MKKEMLSVVIADDDRLVLKDLVHLIDWKKQGFQIKGTAQSGEDALGLVHKYKPELLITDIRMIGMDGLSLIEQAHQSYPEMKFLIISAYHEFDYVRKAMASGVSDYILKTEINAPSLIRKLHDIRDLYFTANSNLEALRLKELQNFFDSEEDKISPDGDSKNFYPHLQELRSEKYYFIEVGSTQMFNRDIKKSVRETAAYMASIAPVFYEVTGGYCAKPVYCIFKEKIVLGISPDIAAQKKTAPLKELLSHLQFRFSVDSEQFSYFYLEKRTTLEEFKKYIQKMDYLVIYHLLFPAKRIRPFEELDSLHYIPTGHTFPFHAIVFSEDQEENNFFLIKDYIYECCRNYDILSIEVFFQHFCALMEVSSNNALSLPDQVVAPSPEFLLKWCFNTLHQCIQIHNNGIPESFSPNVEKAVHFIKQNYGNSDLSSSDIAEYVGLSSNRLGILFKQDTGCTINEYVNQYRVQRAVELLEKTSLKIYEISGKCGYKSSQYFSQIIFQKTGKHPIDYRKAKKS